MKSEMLQEDGVFLGVSSKSSQEAIVAQVTNSSGYTRATARGYP
jgi:hypothetical protein